MDNTSPAGACGTCGAANRASAKFCASCGSALEPKLRPQNTTEAVSPGLSPTDSVRPQPAEVLATGHSQPTPARDAARLTTGASPTCPNGHPVSSTTRFCGTCGTPVAAAPETSARSAEHDNSAATTRISAFPSNSPPPPPPRSSGTFRNDRQDDRSRVLIVAIVVVILVMALAGGLIFFISQKHSSPSVVTASKHATAPAPRTIASTPGDTTAPTPAVSGGSSTVPTTSTDTAQSEAVALNNLLSSSAAARSGVQDAYNDIDSCGSNLESDYTTLEQAATARQGLLTNFSQLGLSQLPQSQAMIEDLVSAWNNSVTADQSFAMWAQDEMNGGCTQQDHSDPNWVAGNSASVQADTAKSSFTGLWDSTVAPAYNLQQWQPTQI